MSKSYSAREFKKITEGYLSSIKSLLGDKNYNIFHEKIFFPVLQSSKDDTCKVKLAYFAGMVDTVLRCKVEQGETLTRSYLKNIGKAFKLYAGKNTFNPEKFYRTLQDRMNPNTDPELTQKEEVHEILNQPKPHIRKNARTFPDELRAVSARDSGDLETLARQAPDTGHLIHAGLDGRRLDKKF